MGCSKHIVALFALLAVSIAADRAAAQDQSRFFLNGVVTKPDGSSMALLSEPTLTQDRARFVREGDRIGPYRVAAIKEDRVELDGPSGKVIVRLSSSAGSGAPVSAAVPVSAAAAEATLQRAAEPELKPGKEVRDYLDRVMDPRIRNSGGFSRFVNPPPSASKAK